MLHQGRYFSWSQRTDKPGFHISLQFAMWALAAASSAHLQHMRESLYTRARSSIETLDHEFESANAACLQAAQTWLLLTHYEFRYMSYRRAWLTAGRAFRLIQLAKLYEIDRNDNISLNMAHPEAWAEAEEKRRTYWLAYCLDRFLNISDEWPLSLHEEAVSSKIFSISFLFFSSLTTIPALYIPPCFGIGLSTHQTSHDGIPVRGDRNIRTEDATSVRGDNRPHNALLAQRYIPTSLTRPETIRNRTRRSLETPQQTIPNGPATADAHFATCLCARTPRPNATVYQHARQCGGDLVLQHNGGPSDEDR